MLCTPLSSMMTISPARCRARTRRRRCPARRSRWHSTQDVGPPSVPPSRPSTSGRTPERVPRADQRAVVQRDQAVGALHLAQRVDQPVHHGGVEADGDEVDEHLAVRGALEQAAAVDQAPAQAVRVGQVAVVRHGEAAEGEVGIERLDVAQRRLAGGGVAVVAERRRARAALPSPWGREKLSPTSPRPLVGVEDAALVQADDARRFLAPVLEGV